MKKNILFSAILFFSLFLNAQDAVQSYIINIENGKAYLDITSSTIKVGDVLSIREETGYMVHPITKKKIKKEGKILADLEIIEVYDEYSIATIYPEEAINKIKTGMLATMPALPNNYAEESKKHNQEEQIPTSISSADGIVERYLQVTGLNKWINKNILPPFYKKEQLSYTTTKGKKETSNIYSAFDLSSKKLFIKHNIPKDNFFIAYSKVFAVNGHEGWARFKKRKTIKLKSKQITNIWSKLSDIFALQIYDAYKWERKLIGEKIIKGQKSTGVMFTFKGLIGDMKKSISITQYFNDSTGLISYSESSLGMQSESLAYKQFGDLLLSSKTINIYAKGKIKQEEIILQEMCFDCPLDNSLFSKEGVKNAFK